MKERVYQDLLSSFHMMIEPDLTFVCEEERGLDGRIDLKFTDKDGATLVCELKRWRVTPENVPLAQLQRYRKQYPNARLMLVAPYISPMAKKILQNHGYESKDVPVNDLLEEIHAESPVLFDYARQKITRNRPFVPAEEVIGAGKRLGDPRNIKDARCFLDQVWVAFQKHFGHEFGLTRTSVNFSSMTYARLIAYDRSAQYGHYMLRFSGTRFDYLAVGYGDARNKDIQKMMRSYFRAREKALQQLLGTNSTAIKDWKVFEWDLYFPWSKIGQLGTVDEAVEAWVYAIRTIRPFVDAFFDRLAIGL